MFMVFAGTLLDLKFGDWFIVVNLGNFPFFVGDLFFILLGIIDFGGKEKNFFAEFLNIGSE